MVSMNWSRSAGDLSSEAAASNQMTDLKQPEQNRTSSRQTSSASASSSGWRLRSFGAWLQERSKSLNEVHGALKPWKRWTSAYRRQRQQHSNRHEQQQQQQQQRELPPVPVEQHVDTDEEDRLGPHEEHPELMNLALDLENLSPGTVFLPDDHFNYDERGDDDDGGDGSCKQEDFSRSLEKVKECGWYWGPISGDVAERLLFREPDGSFVLRDSSDARYIFSLTFKLNGSVRHVRIEHEQGNFSFGTFTKFKSHTIVDFIENAVAHSQSGRYLFFLHRRPILGPMRVQLLHPVSRFKTIQSLKHQCRFVILQHVPRDLLHTLPLPPKVQEYLNTPFYYSESIADEEAREEALKQVAAAAHQSEAPAPET